MSILPIYHPYQNTRGAWRFFLGRPRALSMAVPPSRLHWILQRTSKAPERTKVWPLERTWTAVDCGHVPKNRTVVRGPGGCVRSGRIWFLRYSRFLFFLSPAIQSRKLRHTVLDTTQSVLRDMTIHEYLRHPQGMLFKDITKDMILNMIWIR